MELATKDDLQRFKDRCCRGVLPDKNHS